MNATLGQVASAPRTVYVTGATGFVGSHVAELLKSRSYAVRLLVRSAARLPEELQTGYELVEGSLEDAPEKLAGGLRGCDEVYHVAGLIGAVRQSDFDRVNIDGTRNLLRAVATSGTVPRRFLLVSSLAAFGPSDGLGRPRVESDLPSPRTMYGRSKLAGERAAMEEAGRAGIPLTFARPCAVYGPRDKAILEFFKYMARGIEVGFGREERRLDLIHVRDLARGIVLAAESPQTIGKGYFLTDAGAHRFRNVMGLLRKVLAPRKTRILIAPVWTVKALSCVNDLLQRMTGKVRLPNSDKLGELLPLGWCASGAAAERDFDFRCDVELEAGLRETGEWYERAGWIRVRR